MTKNLTFILIFLVTVLVIVAGYLIFQNQKLINQFSKQTSSPSPSTITSPEPSASLIPSNTPSPQTVTLTLALTENAIKTNVNSKNYQGLIPYMTTPKVFVVLQATECCGDKTPEEAAEQMTYIEDGVPFDFNQESETVKNLKAKNPALSQSYIGLSTVNEQLIAFNIDNENHITNIEMSASWKLYNQ